jgi:hypothetical protein
VLYMPVAKVTNQIFLGQHPSWSRHWGGGLVGYAGEGW